MDQWYNHITKNSAAAVLVARMSIQNSYYTVSKRQIHSRKLFESNDIIQFSHVRDIASPLYITIAMTFFQVFTLGRRISSRTDSYLPWGTGSYQWWPIFAGSGNHLPEVSHLTMEALEGLLTSILLTSILLTSLLLTYKLLTSLLLTSNFITSKYIHF